MYVVNGESPELRLQRPRISVLLCSHNRADKLRSCLSSFKQQSLPAEQFELVCVNDGSSDGETGRVMKEALNSMPGTYWEHAAPKGLAASRNTAMRRAGGDFLLFIREDTVAAPDLLEQHLKTQTLDSGSKLVVPGSLDIRAELLERRPVLRVFSETSFISACPEMLPGQSWYINFRTRNLSVPRQAWEAAGDFDNSFGDSGVEDVEWGYRLEKNGYRVRNAPRAGVVHENEVSSVAEFCRRQLWVASDFVTFFNTHPAALWPSLLKSDRLKLSQSVVALKNAQAEVLKKAEFLAAQDFGEHNSRDRQAPVISSLRPLLQWLQKYYWDLGLLKGLETLGIDSFESMRNGPHKSGSLRGTGEGHTEPPPSPTRHKMPRIQKSPPVVSVIIPTYNRAEVLKECLAALACQNFPFGSFETIVVDDGSSDNTSEVVQQARTPFEVQYIRQENRGPAVARNAGIKCARGELILILNDDAIVSRDVVAGHYLVHSEKKSDRLAVLGTREYRNEDKLRLLNFLYDEVPFSMRVYGLQEGFLPAPYFVTFNISLRKKDFVATGGFDEDFRTAIGEDSEFGTRWQNMGGSILFVPRLRAFHLHDLTVDGLRSMIVREAFNSLILFNKHRTLWRPESTRILLQPESEMLDFIEKTGQPLLAVESILRKYENLPVWELQGCECNGVRIDGITDFVIAMRKIYPQYFSYVTLQRYLNDPEAREIVRKWLGPEEIEYLNRSSAVRPIMQDNI